MWLWAVLSVPLLLFSVYLKEKFHRYYLDTFKEKTILFLFSLTLIFIAVSECVFWNEFHSRFNFIAVDYLIYTNEVLANIKESFPVGLISAGLIFLAIVVTTLISKLPFKDWNGKTPLKNKAAITLVGHLIPAFLSLGVAPWLENFEKNYRRDQLARNGIVEFLRAFRSNRIDYKAFYKTLPDEEVDRIYQSKNVENTEIDFSLKDKKPNVVIIAVESLGAKFIAPLGGFKDTTPYWVEERAFVGNYQYVGYYRDTVLTILGPNRRVQNFSYDPITKKQKKLDHSAFVDEAIAHYQLASRMLDNNLYNKKQ